MSAARPLLAALTSLALAAAPLVAQQAGTGEPWQIIPLPQSSLVYARDGSLIGEIGKQHRTSVSIRTLPRYLPQAFIAVEDQRFYEHDGVDLVGIAGAIKGKILGTHRGGASTITQQLVGYMHPDQIDRRDISLQRKIREQMAAREMEKHYTKEQILEAYLNVVNLGHGWYGIEAAARHYFGKSAAKLTLAEAATLAGLPKSQPYYDPIAHPGRALQRRNLILGMMEAQGYISDRVARQAKAEPVRTAPNGGMSAPAQYFVDLVRTELEKDGVPVMNGGYRVLTTLDPALQTAAVQALLDGTAQAERRPGYSHPVYTGSARASGYLQGAVVVIDPFTGDVRALVGGRNYQASPYDRAVLALRQPGSSFKPFVYAKALEDSIAASSIVPDTALAIPLQNGTVYRPRDDDGRFLGDITLREAIIHSRNSVAVQLGLRIGMDSVAAFAQRLGLATPIYPSPASAIGASGVHPLDFAAAYSAFATDGAVVEPRVVQRVEDRAGRVVFSRAPSAPRQVIDPRVAFIVRDMMRDAAERGTGAAARRAVKSSVPVAGKTGTTNDNVDVWFLGMTPELVGAVWLGFDRPASIARGVAGGSLAAPIWGQMMARYYATRPAPAPWAAPPGLVFAELDRATGQLADSTTPPTQRYVEYFLPGTEPEPLRLDPWKVPQWGAVVR